MSENTSPQKSFAVQADDLVAALRASVDGPHDPAGTAALGDVLAEALRTLNYATVKGGLRYPGDVYQLVGDLRTAAARTPQLCEQTGRWLTTHADQCRDTRGNDVNEVIAEAVKHLNRAAKAAQEATDAFGAAHSTLTNLAHRPSPGDEQDED